MEKTPVIVKAYDLLEWGGEDIRSKSFLERRKLLETLHRNIVISSELSDEKSIKGQVSNLDFPHSFEMTKVPLFLSERMQFNSWDEVAQEREVSRAKNSEGVMVKRLDSPYQVGRKKGDWWKWKVDPLTIDAVLTYAMRVAWSKK